MKRIIIGVVVVGLFRVAYIIDSRHFETTRKLRDLEARLELLEPWHHRCNIECGGVPHTAEALRCGRLPRHRARLCPADPGTRGEG